MLEGESECVRGENMIEREGKGKVGKDGLWRERRRDGDDKRERDAERGERWSERQS